MKFLILSSQNEYKFVNTILEQYKLLTFVLILRFLFWAMEILIFDLQSSQDIWLYLLIF